MTTSTEEGSWLYLQIFPHPQAPLGEHQGRLIALCDQLLEPTLRTWVAHCAEQGWIRRFFFIRYAEGGYHLRLRLLGENAQLQQQVSPLLEDQLAQFFAAHRAELPDLAPSITAENLVATGHLRYAAYEPELDKYGGVRGVAMAEEHFELSSEIAFDILSVERQTGTTRSQFALEIMRLYLQSYGTTIEGQILILRGYTHYWLSHVSAGQLADIQVGFESNFQRKKARLHARLGAKGMGRLESIMAGNPTSPFRRLRTHLIGHFARLSALEEEGALETSARDHLVAHTPLLSSYPVLCHTPIVGLQILPNYIHMMNNRLGLSPWHEIQLTYLLYRFLEEASGQNHSTQIPLALEPAQLSTTLL